MVAKKTRSVARNAKDDKLIAIQFKGGAIEVHSDRKFAGSLPGFGFVEEQHEASRFLFRRRHLLPARSNRQTQTPGRSSQMALRRGECRGTAQKRPDRKSEA